MVGVASKAISPAAIPAGAESVRLLSDIRTPVAVLCDSARRVRGVAPAGTTAPGLEVLGALPAIYPEWLGDRRFCETHGCRFPYIVGEMARGLATPHMVVAAAKAGLLGFYGAAGLEPDVVAKAVAEITREVGALPWGSNLIHSPNEPALERAFVDLYLAQGVTRVSASAFMSLTPEVVRYAYRGLTADSKGNIRRTNYLFAKISRPEVATQFLSPAPQSIVRELVREGRLTASEADLAQHVPVASDVTAEGDSGGHTDNRPLSVLLPLILRERDRTQNLSRGVPPVRVGAAGGLGTPSSLAAAFSLGAAYVLTGTINQTAVESGLSERARAMLLDAGMADVTMAPSADMFELGVKVQVLRKGSLYAQRSARLYEIYRAYGSVAEIPAETARALEKDIFRRSLAEVAEDVRRYFERRDPAELRRAAEDPRHQMALLFRWYLGMSSRWPITGDPQRQLDYQIWCGPAIAAFNDWVAGSYLADPANRTVAQIGLNLLEGAALAIRAQQARVCGVDVPATLFDRKPKRIT
jgi:PfaD family protein